jgi:hypothetical protein
MLTEKFFGNEEGLAAVEFAIIAPVLLMFLVGVVDFGLYINDRMRLESLARASAEYVVKGGSEDAVMQDVVYGAGGVNAEESEEWEMSGQSICSCGDGEEVVCGSSCPDNGYQRRYYTFSITRNYTPLFPYPGIPEVIEMTGDARLQIQ